MEESGGGGLERGQPPEKMEMRLTFKGGSDDGKSGAHSPLLEQPGQHRHQSISKQTSPTRSKTNYPGQVCEKWERGRLYFMGKDCEQYVAKVGPSAKS